MKRLWEFPKRAAKLQHFFETSKSYHLVDYHQVTRLAQFLLNSDFGIKMRFTTDICS